MIKLIIIVGLVFCLHAWAQEATEPAWKTKLRDLISQVAGAEWGAKLFGEPPRPSAPEVVMPEIPKNFKKSTDVGSYTKKIKGPTEYDRLPAERKRQFDFKFIEELFLVTRKSEAKDEDLANWLNTLEQGGSREGIYQALVLDEVYSALEGIEERPTERLVSFSLKFSEKFLAQTFKANSISDLNLYSLKRIFTEKGLDLLEYYEVKDLDALYRWYGNFSAFIAQEHGSLLDSEIRKQESALYHYEWAKNMPIQHIKSEFIIKLHKIMNGLQFQAPS